MSHTKVTMMSNVDVGCSGFEIFSDGFQDFIIIKNKQD